MIHAQLTDELAEHRGQPHKQVFVIGADDEMDPHGPLWTGQLIAADLLVHFEDGEIEIGEHQHQFAAVIGPAALAVDDKLESFAAGVSAVKSVDQGTDLAEKDAGFVFDGGEFLVEILNVGAAAQNAAKPHVLTAQSGLQAGDGDAVAGMKFKEMAVEFLVPGVFEQARQAIRTNPI